MKKRVLSALLALVLVVSSVPTPVFATDAPDAAAQQATGSTQDTESDTQDALQDVPEGNVQSDPEGDMQNDPESGMQSDAQPAMLATGSIPYLDENGEIQAYEGEYTAVAEETTSWSNGWYLVEGTVKIESQITVSGSVTLILADGALLDAPGGIHVVSGNSLTITAQSKDQNTMGKLTAGGSELNYRAAIGGADREQAGDIMINGGWVIATAGSYAAGIGAIGGNAVIGTITINGGVVEATARDVSAGIGGSNGAIGGDITINGGKVTTTMTGSTTVGIGAGYESSSKRSTTVTINGGSIVAQGDRAGISASNGIINISGGEVKASSGSGAGIDAPNGTIAIRGGEVEAGAGDGSGVGIGTYASSGINIFSVNILISGGRITANASGGPGIGCNSSVVSSASAEITITGGTVKSNAIGGGANSTATFSTGTSGSAVITAGSIAGSDNNTDWDCIWFASETEGKVYGKVTLGGNLTVVEGQTLTIPAGASLVNNGSITNSGRILVKTGGSYRGNAPAGNPVEYEGVPYLDENGEMQQTTSPVGLVTGSIASLTDGWYLVEGTVNAADGLSITGNVTLVLADGAALNLDEEYLLVNAGSSLTITAQSKDENEMGSLTVNCPYDPNQPDAVLIGIGGDSSTVAIWGGKVTATAYTVGIGGNNSTVTIRGGVVRATSTRTDGTSNYAIGGSSSKVTISGGSIITASSYYNGYDIGSSQLSTDKPDGSNGNALLCAGSFNTSWESLDYISVSRDGTREYVYGDVTLGDDLTVAEGQTLTISAGTKLTVPDGVTLTNNGSIWVEAGGRYVGKETGPNSVSYERVNYLDEKGETQTKRADEVTLVTNSTTELNEEDGGWYLVEDTTVYWKKRVAVVGNVTLILADRATLEALEGIEVASGSSLTITAQSDGKNMGELIAKVNDDEGNAAIGGSYKVSNGNAGSITINGGSVTANARPTGSERLFGAAGIGGGWLGTGGSIMINGGVVEATGDTFSAGIGGGRFGGAGDITINGGNVTATSGDSAAGIGPGLGTGSGKENGGSITINGGEITATGGVGDGMTSSGAGIGGSGGVNVDSITISGGIVKATGGNGAADIGNSATFSTGANGNAVIYAASITGSEDTTGWNCIWFESETGDGSVYGSITLSDALTIANGQTLTIEPGAKLTVPANMTLTNNGSIKVALGGAYSGDQPTGNKVTYWIGWDANDDGEAEVSDYLAYGETPVYSGAIPAKEADAQYTYTFRDWDSPFAVVTEAKLYTAQFTGTLNRYTVTLPESPVGYTLTPDSGTTLDYGTDFTFTLTLAAGYSAAPDFAVKANGVVLTATNNLYTITVEGDTTITVEGVEDLTAPDTTLTIAENSFKKLLNQITFGLFFKENVEVTLAANDAGSGLAELFYLRSEAPLNEEELKDAAWQIYTGPITETVEDAKRFVYYGKAVDKAGNVMLVSSEGVVFDTTAPTFTGVLPDSVYYTTQQVEVQDTNLCITGSM